MTGTSAEPTSVEEAQEALRVARSALHDSDPGSENRENLLENLGHTLIQAYDVSKQQATVDEAIVVYEKILRLQPEGHDHRALSLANFGGILQRFSEDHTQSEVHLDRAIVLLRESLRLRPPGDSARAQSLSSLGNALLTCFHQRGHAAVLVEAGLLHAEALSLCPVGSEDRDNSLNHLANVRFAQFQLNGPGETGSIAHVVALYREALELRPLGHVWRDVSLSNLGNALLAQYRFEGDEDTLNEATHIHREALGLRSCTQTLRSFFLQSLGDALMVFYAAHLSRDILAEAVALYRDAVQLRPEGDSRRDQALTALAGALLCNFGEYGIWDSLSEAIALHREVLSRCAPTHRDGALSHLANALQSGFWIRPDLTVLDEIIDLHREALQLRPPGHLARGQTLSDYANALGDKFEYAGDTHALALAVALHRESVEARRPGDLQRYMSLGNLARTLYVQAAYGGQVDCLPEAIAAKREALQYCLDGHPDRSWLRLGLGVCLLVVDSPLFDYDEAMSHIIAGLGDDYASARKRLQLTLLEFRRVEGACAHAIRELKLPTSHCSAHMLKAYRLIIRLQLRVASLGLDPQTRLQVIAGTDEVSRNAAAHALRLELLLDAVEILEEGRGIFWTQALRLRASELDGLPAEDGITLRTIFQSLEKRESAADKTIVHAAQRDVDIDHRRRLSDQAEALISEIRTRSGHERFLMPPSFDALMQTLPEGYVILLVVSALGCDALLLNGPASMAQSIRLTLVHDTFNAAAIRSRLPRDANLRDVNEDIAEELRAMRVSSKRHEGLEGILASIWSSVVHPIVQALTLKPVQAQSRPRVWWCVTGELSFLPIHAAGQYNGGSVLESAADYFVSSYVPTLSALTKARSRFKSIACDHVTGLLVCEASSGSRYLPNVVDEVRAAERCFEAVSARVLNTISAHTKLAQLREMLEGKPAHILHLATHGVQEPNPLDSAFLVEDGRLSIEDIMQLNLPDAALAFLSACQTAKGDEKQPDQVVHLAASMLFCGFRSVIGTMWLMHDEDGPRVARCVYEYLFKNGRLSLDDVPYALDAAVTMLREAGVPAERWTLFVHMGG